MKLAMLVNDVESEDPRYATTRLGMTAVDRGHEVWYLGTSDFKYNTDERLAARARRAPRKRSVDRFVDALREGDAEPLDVESLDVLLLRNDPAVDAIDRPWAQSVGVIFGQLAASRGVLVLNNPSGLSKALNKLYFQQFPKKVRPATLITRDPDGVRAFVDEHDGSAVLKPLQGSGGQNVFLVRPDERPNMNQMIEAVARDGYIVVQEYLPAAADGDVRMFLLDGQPLVVDGEFAAFRRARQGDDLRSNMHAGGTSEPVEVDEAMLTIAEACRPRLTQDGMAFVGLDIVGDKLMEVNVFSPGGLNTLRELTGIEFAVPIIQALERKVRFRDENPSRLPNAELAML